MEPNFNKEETAYESKKLPKFHKSISSIIDFGVCFSAIFNFLFPGCPHRLPRLFAPSIRNC